MRKNFLIIILTSVLIISGVSACGSYTGGSIDESAETAETVDIAPATPDEEAAHDADETDTSDSLSDDEEIEDAAENDDMSDETDGDENTDIIVSDDYVENNGGYFVRIGDCVWFRSQQPEILNGISYDGFFLNGCAEETDRTLSPDPMICYFDLKTGLFYDVITDTERGFGPLYYADDKLYSMRAVGVDGTEIYRMNMDGSGVETVCDGRIAGITETGGIVVMPNPDDAELAIYKDGVKKASYEMDFGFLTYCGSVGDDVIFMYGDASDVGRFMELTSDGDVIYLGAAEIWASEVEYFAHETAPDGSDVIYILMAIHGGEDGQITERTVIRFIHGDVESAEVIDAEDISNHNEPNAKLLLTGDEDEVMIVSHLDGELGLSEGTWGDLILYDSPYSAFRLVTDYISEDPYEMVGSDTEAVMEQSMTYLGGTAFICDAHVRRSPDEDIGQMRAYLLRYLNTDFVRFIDYISGEQLINDGEGQVYGL